MDFDLCGLLVFRHLAQSGSFTETGKYWKISQPAVSMMISRLESAAGLVLLERTSSGARLTADGMLFLERAQEVCEAYLGFVDGMRHLGRRMDREVLVGMDRSWFGSRMQDEKNSLLAPLGVSPVFSELTGDWTELLESSRFDVILATRFLRAGLSTGIQEAVIRKERGITVAWNPDFHAFNETHFSFPEILRTSVLIPDSGVVSNFAKALQVWCEHAYGIQPANTLAFATEAEAAEAAAAGLGVLLAPGDAVPRLGDIAKGLSVQRTFEFLLPESYTFGVYCRSDETSKEVLGVAAALVKLGRRLFPHT